MGIDWKSFLWALLQFLVAYFAGGAGALLYSSYQPHVLGAIGDSAWGVNGLLYGSIGAAIAYASMSKTGDGSGILEVLRALLVKVLAGIISLFKDASKGA